MSPVRFPALGAGDEGWIGGAALAHVVTIPTLIDPDPDHGVETHGALEDAGHLSRPRQAVLLEAGAPLQLSRRDARPLSEEDILSNMLIIFLRL